jgi:hypothetical protein
MIKPNKVEITTLTGNGARSGKPAGKPIMVERNVSTPYAGGIRREKDRMNGGNAEKGKK